ncbi:transposase [Nitzschia inconspicua]|uniref:Transposase n=1 Tax=Nitzschia inconspicua TaxID=303405 RepID=A0A9K3Q1X5_9STRA|nr:transposase [Nitzschia inconspicua]
MVQAAKTKTKYARDAAKAAIGEREAKLKCLEYEKENRSNGQLAIDNFTPPKAPLALARAYDDISCGEMVFVQPDLSPGKCRHGGLGHVIDFEGTGPSRTFAVRYHQSSLMGATTESGISYKDISRMPDGAWEITSSNRKRSASATIVYQTQPSKKEKSMTLVEQLVEARARGMGKGWRAKQLGVFNPNCQVAKGIDHDFLFMADYQFLVGWMAASDSGKTNTKGQDRRKNGKFTGTGAKASKAISLSYLHFAWGVGKNYGQRLKEKYPNGISRSSPTTQPTTGTKKEPESRNVIDSYEAASRFFTDKELFLQTRMHQMRKEDDHLAFEGGAAARERNNEYRRLATVAWNSLDDQTKAYWESKRRSHLALQPHMRDRIIECFRANPSKSYRQVEEEINGWCSNTTIHKWLSSQDGYCLYVQRPLPLLSREQMAKHVKFSKLVVDDFWGLPPTTKVLLIHYDEKWFYGFVGRANAKMAEKVGLDKVQAFLHHKSHINKVMCVAFTGYAFEGNMENGGHGLKLGFYRCNAAKIAKKQVRQSRRDEHGNLRYDGEIKRKKGDCYMVDCVVTGSDQGTSDNPKFSLKSLFEEQIFPLVESLLKDNYEGFIPVIQGDNAGPHIDAEYINYVKEYCLEKGWVWAPQAPQMPHANNLDLAIFPAMSRRHSALLGEYSNTEAPAEEIWNAALSVWKDLPNSTVARGFILGKRILNEVIRSKGDNTFLTRKDFHSDVRHDFEDTFNGIKKKVRVL